MFLGIQCNKLWLLQDSESEGAHFLSNSQPAGSKRFRAVSEQTTRKESQRPRKKWGSLSFHFSGGQNWKSGSSVFLCSETKQKRLLRRLSN